MAVDGMNPVRNLHMLVLIWLSSLQKDQFDAALAYLGNVGDQPIDWKKFEEEHGVGVEVCPPPFHTVAAHNSFHSQAACTSERHVQTCP